MTYSIVATLGPASKKPEIWEAMADAGVDYFRLNTSFFTIGSLLGWLEKITAFTTQRQIQIVLDLQGSKWRLGVFPPFCLEAGESVLFVFGERSEEPGVLPVPHSDFFQAAKTSFGEITLNDGKNRLRVQGMGEDWIRARIIQGGPLTPGKGVHLTASSYRMTQLTEKDQKIVGQFSRIPGIWLAISYVRDAEEMRSYRAILGSETRLIAKLERQPAIYESKEISTYADQLWICRGDLGSELGLSEMAIAVSRLPAPSEIPIPMLMAGQVLEHMVENPHPTRSEVCYLHDILAHGYAGVVLSDETAMGRYPVETCRVAAMFR